MTFDQKCEFVGKGADNRGRCREEAEISKGGGGMGLLAYCVDCSRNLCETHLKTHCCGAMRKAGAKKGDAPARYEASE